MNTEQRQSRARGTLPITKHRCVENEMAPGSGELSYWTLSYSIGYHGLGHGEYGLTVSCWHQ